MKKIVIAFVIVLVTMVFQNLIAADNCSTLSGKKAYFCYRFQYFPSDGLHYRVDFSQVIYVEWKNTGTPCTFYFKNGHEKTFQVCADAVNRYGEYLDFFKTNPEFISKD